MTVTGVNDDLDDGDVAYSIVTAAATSADCELQRHRMRPTSAVTNTDNDTAGITVSTDQRPDTTEAGGTATFTVVLNAAADRRRDGRPDVQRRHRRHGAAGRR